MAPRSVADIGCGSGAWLSVWRELGRDDILGIDGPYVRQERLKIPADGFLARDVSRGFDAGRRFDLAQCLEVAEHIPPDASESFVQSLCATADVVLFSAGQPGQGGEWHVNERPLEYWRSLFREHGYEAFDLLRPKLCGDLGIEPWYRYNSIVYANFEGQQRMTAQALSSLVQVGLPLASYGDWKWRLRLAVLRPLPVSVVTMLSRIHYRLQNVVFAYTSRKPSA